MSLETFSSTVLWLICLVVPVLLFALGNPFRSVRAVLGRALLAIAAGWVLAIAYVVAAQALAAYGASAERLAQLYAVDGASRAFALVLGWVPATVSVAMFWLARVVLRQ